MTPIRTGERNSDRRPVEVGGEKHRAGFLTVGEFTDNKKEPTCGKHAGSCVGQEGEAIF